MKRFSIVALTFVLAFGLVVQPAASEVNFGVDAVNTLQNLNTKDSNGNVNNESMAFGSVQANLHIKGDVADGVKAYAEVLLNPPPKSVAGNDVINDAFDVRVYQGYAKFTQLVPMTTVKAGAFELPYGTQYKRTTTNGDVMDNVLIGNPLVNPTAVQTGLALHGEMSRFGWAVAVTNGMRDLGGHGEAGAPNDFTDSTNGERGTAYLAKLTGDFAPGISGAFSYYRNDQSKTNPGITGGATSDNLFGSQSVIYDGVMAPAPSMGSGQDITAWQLDLKYELPMGGYVLADYGTMEDKDTNGASMPSDPEQNWNYYDVEAKYDITPLTYVAARYGKAEQTDDGATAEYSKAQLGVGHKLNENTLAKLEYVKQADEASGDEAELSGFIAEVGISF